MSTRPQLIAVRSITESEALKDINPRPAPKGVPQVFWSRGQNRHSQSLGWYRGHQAGIHDAYLTLREHYPEIAADLIKAFNMKENGNLGLS